MMTKAIPALIAAMLATPITAAEPIDGLWTTADRSGQVRVGVCGATRCGRLVKFLVVPPQGIDQRDVNNPAPALRSRRLLGTPILSGFKSDGSRWTGTIYDPRNGKSYRSLLRRKDASTLEVKGCIGPFCQTQVWKRAGD